MNKQVYEMTPMELANGNTDWRRKEGARCWENPYCREICRRTGKLAEYEADPMGAAQAAFRGYGIVAF